MEAAGIRDGLRATAELNALGFHQRSSKAFMRTLKGGSVKEALTTRDLAFGDYRAGQASEPSGQL
jgi:enoyl-CoA hydratase